MSRPPLYTPDEARSVFGDVALVASVCLIFGTILALFNKAWPYISAALEAM